MDKLILNLLFSYIDAKLNLFEYDRLAGNYDPIFLYMDRKNLIDRINEVEHKLHIMTTKGA